MIQYKKILLELQSKLEMIAKLPKPGGNGETYKGIEISEDGIQYNSETFYSGCGTEEYSFFVTWDEINEPLEYFEEKYKKEFKKVYEEIESRRKQEEEKNKEFRRQEYERLKKEFEK